MTETLTRRAASRLSIALACGLLGSAAFAQGPAPTTTELDLAGTPFSFASQEQTQRLIQEDDAWLQATSAFQRAATMGNTKAPADSATPTHFKSFLAATTLPWTAKEQARWQAAVHALSQRLAKLQLAYTPQRIQLALTNGRDSANTPYTRGAVIYVPKGYATTHVSDLELLAHEYFHILTREQPALAQRIYALLGFEPAGELEWPAEWLPARIANPDAPLNHNVMTLQRGGKTFQVMPVLVARRTVLRPKESVFDVLDVRLLTVTPGSDLQPSRALRGPKGQLQWMELDEAEDYVKRLGGNTHYVFHPEETAADNFSYLVSGRKVHNPQLLTQLAKLLRERR